MRILVTGMAGFIGYHLTKRLISEGYDIVGIDNINSYYDQSLKLNRLKDLGFEEEIKSGINRNSNNTATFYKEDLKNKDAILKIFADEKIDYVYHIAAQAGVRYSIDHPDKYIDSNIIGFHTILEASRQNKVKHLVFASSSSIYGLNRKMPFQVEDNVDHPISLYAATKKSNELTAHSYAYLFKIPVTGLRFFTVYGPWGRPDMAYFKFVKRILNNEAIDVYNHGDMSRDFTYVDDIVESLIRLLEKPAKEKLDWNPEQPNPQNSIAPYQIFNIGNNSPIRLMDFINEIELALNKKAEINLMPIQPGDVQSTFADVSHLFEYINYKPKTSLSIGIKNFVNWYLSYYKI